MQQREDFWQAAAQSSGEVAAVRPTSFPFVTPAESGSTLHTFCPEGRVKDKANGNKVNMCLIPGVNNCLGGSELLTAPGPWGLFTRSRVLEYSL